MKEFKARVVSAETYPVPADGSKFRMENPLYVLIFTKNKVFFDEKTKKLCDNFGQLLPFTLINGVEYELEKLHEQERFHTKDAPFKITCKNGVVVNLKTDFINGVKLRWIHNRYYIQKLFSLSVIQTLTVAIFTFIISAFPAAYIGYQNGVQKEKQSIQDHIQSLPLKQSQKDSLIYLVHLK